MYEFHQNYIKEIYGCRAKLFFISTDSSANEVETNGVYQNVYMDEDMFHFSEYQESLRLDDAKNIKIIGEMKD